jgi:hypothetical protein
MAINYDLINKGGISLSANFELLSEKPLDARQVVPNIEGLQNLIDNAAAYEGMVVYIVDQKTHYKVHCVEYNGVKYYGYRELNLTEDELKALIASETTGSFDAAEQAIETEVLERQAAIAAEKTAREAADEALSQSLTDTFTANLSAETQRAQEKEDLLSAAIGENREDIVSLNSNLATEIATRLAEDATIRAELADEIQRASQKEAELDENLAVSFNTLSTQITENCGNEALAREAIAAQLRTELDETKVAVAAQLSAETEARSLADTELQQQFSDEKAATEDAISRLQTDIVTESETARTAEANLNQELTKVNALLAAEAAARAAEDSLLSETLTTNATELTTAIATEKAEREAAIESVTNAYTAGIAQEKADREAAEQVLASKIVQESERASAEETRLNNLISQATSAFQADHDLLSANIEAEIQARILGDSNLQTSITNEISRATQQETALEASINTAVTNLTTTINSRCDAETAARNILVEQTTTEFTAKVNNLAAQLTAEGLAREARDTELTNLFQTETTIRENTISNLQTELSNEIEAARGAEETLNKKIEKEISDRNLSNLALTNQLSAEIAERETAITTLNTTLTANLVSAIGTEEAARIAAVETVTSALDSAKAEIDLIVGRDNLTDNIVEIISIPQAIQTATSYCDEALKAYRVSTDQDAIDEGLSNRIGVVENILNDKTEDETTVKGLVSRVVDLEAIDHTKLAEDASAAAVTTILDGAPEKFDTLKEIATWIAEENTAEDAASLVTRVSTIEGKSAMGITEDQIENWDGEVGVKAVIDANKSTWDLAGTAVQSSNFESFKTTNSEAIAAAKKAGEDAAAAVDTKLTNYSDAHAGDYTNKQIDDAIDADIKAAIDAEVRRADGTYDTKGTAQDIVDSLKLSETYEPIGAETKANNYTDGKIAAEVGRAEEAYSKVGHKHVVADITDYGTDIADKLDSFNITNISPILAKLVGIGGENQPETVIEAITEYVDSIKPEITPSFSIEDDILIIG